MSKNMKLFALGAITVAGANYVVSMDAVKKNETLNKLGKALAPLAGGLVTVAASRVIK